MIARARELHILLLLALLTGCQQPQSGVEAPIVFRDATSDVNLDFEHVNGMSGQRYIAEMMGAGAALFDFDNDGDLDVYLVQGGPMRAEGAPDSQKPADRLFRNDLAGEADSRALSFTDVSEAAGIRATGYGMGVAVGDYDRDGHPDLYLANFGANQLWRNNGDGTFSQRTTVAGVDDTRLSSSALFFDYDRDGWPDLLVGNYVNFDFNTHKVCRRPDTAPDYCGPQSYDPVPDRLFRNLGDGRFEDKTLEAGLARPGANLGSVTADLNRDGWADVFVANDAMENFLWMNQGDGTFVDEGLARGVAVNARGESEASMGIALGDFDNDLDIDLFLSHLGTETNTLYANSGDGRFIDVTRRAGLAAPSLPFTGFGSGWLDYDNDGRLDLLVVNGAVRTIAEQEAAGAALPLKEIDQMFSNAGQGKFEELNLAALQVAGVSRGAAFGDIDNDGDTDVLVTENNGAVRLLLNETPPGHHWLGLRLLDENGGDAVNAEAVLSGEQGDRQLRVVGVAGSYLSSNDPRLLFGIGEAGGAQRAMVRWPDGSREQWPALEPGQYHELRKGTGDTIKASSNE